MLRSPWKSDGGSRAPSVQGGRTLLPPSNKSQLGTSTTDRYKPAARPEGLWGGICVLRKTAEPETVKNKVGRSAYGPERTSIGESPRTRKQEGGQWPKRRTSGRVLVRAVWRTDRRTRQTGEAGEGRPATERRTGGRCVSTGKLQACAKVTETYAACFKELDP